MKTKIMMSRGSVELLVADEKINVLHGFTAEKPILLMSLTDCSMGDVTRSMWALSDWRLTKFMQPNPYGLERPYESRMDMTPEVYERFKALVPVHRQQADAVYWSTFGASVPGPHQVENALINAKPERMGVTLDEAILFMDAGKEGRWDFKQGRDQIIKAQQEWANATIVTKQDFLSMRLPNTRLQINEHDFEMAERAHKALGLFSTDDLKSILAKKIQP